MMSEDRKQFLEKLNEYYTDQNHIDVTKEVNLVL